MPGFLTTTFATLTMSVALFGRRERSDFLSELEGVRRDALVEAGGEIATAMAVADRSLAEEDRAAAPERERRTTLVDDRHPELDRWDRPAEPDWIGEVGNGSHPHPGPGDRAWAQLEHLWDRSEDEPRPEPCRDELLVVASEPEDVAPEPEAVHDDAPVPVVPVDTDDGRPVVPFGGGLLRLSATARAEVNRSDSTVIADLGEGWCWVANATEDPHAADAVIVQTPAGPLVVGHGSEVLAVVTDDRSTFVAVVSGSTHFEPVDGPRTLAAGQLVLAPEDGPCRVEVATAEAIAAHPVVAENLRLDARA